MTSVLRKSSVLAGAMVLAAALSGLVPASASAAPRYANCASFPGNPNFWACIEQQGGDIVGNGHVDNSTAIMWIQICRQDGDHKCYGTHMGWEVRVPVNSLPAGRYITSFYYGSGHGAVNSKEIQVGGGCPQC